MRFTKFALAASLGLVFVATNVPDTASSAPAKKSSGCNISISEAWTIPATNGRRSAQLRISASSAGRTCATASLVYSITDANGRSLFRQDYQSEFVMLTAQARTPTQMRAALVDWLRLGRSSTFHAELPIWPAGQNGPIQSEFPFTPDKTISRPEYLAVKSNRTPARCYVQGMESINCVIYRNGRIEPFGLQSFPG